ncbi:MAG: endo-1,4-beta-xylanase, partial [Cyclobacteriaceae bacterium]
MNIKNFFFRSLLGCFIYLFFLTSIHGQTLKSKAEQKGKYIGNILSIDGLDQLMQQNFTFPENGIIRNEFNTLVLENDMKMGFVLATPPNDPFNIQPSDFDNKTRMDRFVSYCKTDVSQTLRTRGHALIWYSQAPGWIFDAVQGRNGWNEWGTQQIYDFSESYIKAMVTYFGSTIDEWDVFNEAFSDNQGEVWRSGTWYDKVNSGTYNGQPSSYQLFFEMCFKWADEAANSDVALFYNDYNIEEKGNFKSDHMYGVVSNAVANAAPINGVGFQSHIAHSIISNNYMDNVVDRIRELGALGDDNDGLGGLKVAITELDIHHPQNQNLDDQSIQNSYWQMVSKTLAEPNVDELLVWGISDKDSWITLQQSGYFGDKEGFLPWDGQFVKNVNPGAYTGISDGLNTLPNASFPSPSWNLNWRNHGVHGNANSDGITGVSAPSSVSSGTTVNVAVDYTASQNRDIIILFQLDTSPWTVYQSVKTDVSAGSGNVNISVPLPPGISIADNAYQFQVFITTN